MLQRKGTLGKRKKGKEKKETNPPEYRMNVHLRMNADQGEKEKKAAQGECEREANRGRQDHQLK
jgi:hypothetical protein